MKLSENHKLLHFLNELFDTNIDFSITHSEDFFKSFRDDQSPKVTILKCSDSRVQMESFDKTPQNEVFAIRNIGNQVQTAPGGYRRPERNWKIHTGEFWQSPTRQISQRS